ncbi:hypothetical protein Leryth_011658 [Lithospermum erythrorhizon]|uniref:RING-CH-type domain-containing protein n=1 Tax=Lithospermum erythrorhizon TaxID=34254 RepID=A0AAV3R0R5_LITER|nr:hypothetical protein Leryth_011658 [Lithospermum erythrorhizon]
MSILEVPALDIEHGCPTSSVLRVEEEVESVCFSDVDEGGSCYSQFYYDYCGSECEIVEERVVARRLSSVGQSDILVEIDNGVCEVKVVLEGVERDCRICHLGLDSSSGENGGAIELGCSCKDDLAAAHKKCAETWFKIKGNKTCEICNSIAHNVVVPSEANSFQQTNEMHSISSNSLRGPVSSTSDTRSCFNGHRFMNFLLACMVFAFIISWLFHFDIPS